MSLYEGTRLFVPFAPEYNLNGVTEKGTLVKRKNVLLWKFPKLGSSSASEEQMQHLSRKGEKEVDPL